MYEPTIPPVVDEEGMQSVLGYTYDQLREIAAALQGILKGQYLQTQNVAPTKPQEPQIAFADGINWNPGMGKGLYVYYNGAWHLLETGMDFWLELAKGNIVGHSGVHVFGKNPDIDTGSEDVWPIGGTWVAPTTARVHNIVSSSANDDGSPAGTGAQTIHIEGLNGSYAAVSEVVTLNGVGAVATANSYVIINHMEILTAGSTGSNVGAITATAVTDATVSSEIAATKGASQTGVYQVPAGYTGYLTDFSGSVDSSATASVDLELYVRDFGGAWVLHCVMQFLGSGTTGRTLTFTTPHVVAGKATIKLRATVDTNNVDVTARFDLVLVQN